MNKRKKSLLQRGEECTFLNLKNEKVVVEICNDSLQYEYCEKDVVHLCDPDRGMNVSKLFKLTVLFVSPSKTRILPYGRQEVSTYFVPPWSLDEVKSYCNTVYHKGYDELLQEAYRKWTCKGLADKTTCIL